MKTTFRRLGAAARALCLMVGFIAAAQSAHAACTGPNGNAGDIIYASNYNTMAFCNGTSWTSMAGGVSVTVNTAGGGATPAGATNDVQFNSSGTLSADTGNFTYASGLLSAPNVSATAMSATGAGTFGTINSTGLGTLGSLIVTGGATITGQASITTISTSLIQVGDNGATCTSSLAGSMRYTSGTMQVCDGSGWTNVGIGVPQGTIAAFALTSCPNGWSEYTPARGRFLRGIDNGAGVDPSGTRAPGNVQNDALQDHRHGVASSDAYVSGYGAMAGNGPQSADSTFSRESGHVDNARTSTETRPVNVAVTFCRYDGFQSQLQTGVATLASLTDVSVAGATAGQVLTYDGGTWVASNTTSTGGASGDRITSGTLSIIANTGTAYASLTTNGTTWGYLSSNASYIPTLQTGFENNGTISTTLIQTGANSATCNSGLYGAIRWNATSDTIQVCNTGGWISVASSSVPNTTISQGTANYAAIFSGPNTLVTDSALYVDRTNHYVGIGTSSPGNALAVSGNINATGTINAGSSISVQGQGFMTYYPAGSYTVVGDNPSDWGNSLRLGSGIGLAVYVSGSTRMLVSGSGNVGIGTVTPKSSLTVVGEAQVGTSGASCVSATNGGAIRYASGTLYYCNGSNTWTSLGGGGSPAGSTGDIQFNTSGSFDADTGKFVWDKTNHRLGIGMTPGYDLDVSGSGATTSVGIGRNSNGDVRLEIGGGALGNHNSYIDLTGDATYPDYGLRIIRSYDNSSQIAQKGTGNFYIQTIDQAPIVFRTSSTNRAVIDASGNVGIGTTSPAQKLDVNGVVNTSVGYSISNPYGDFWSAAGHWLSTPYGVFGTNGSYESTWSWNGYRNTSSGWTPLNVGGYTQSAMLGLGSNGFSVYADSTTPTSIYPTLRMRLTPDGNLGIGTTSPASRLDVSGNILLSANGSIISFTDTAGTHPAFVMQSDNNFVLYTYDNVGTQKAVWGVKSLEAAPTFVVVLPTAFSGNVTAPAFLYSSDKRLKSDITAMTGGLAKLDALNPVSFRFTSDPSKTIHLGLIAQDVQKVYPEAVHADEKGFLKLDYPSLIGPIIDMLKEMKGIVFGDHDAIAKLQAANDNLRIELKAEHDARVSETAALKSSNDNLQASLEALETKMREHGL